MPQERRVKMSRKDEEEFRKWKRGGGASGKAKKPRKREKWGQSVLGRGGYGGDEATKFKHACNLFFFAVVRRAALFMFILASAALFVHIVGGGLKRAGVGEVITEMQAQPMAKEVRQ